MSNEKKQVKKILTKVGKDSSNQDLKMAINKERLLDALEKSLGVVTSACKVVGISRKTYYEYLKHDSEFASAVYELQEVALDFAETKLHEQINENNVTATIFYLKTKGKNRGYIERTELTGGNGMPLNQPIDYSQLKTETIEDLLLNGVIEKR